MSKAKDVRALRALVNSYALAVDERDPAALGDLFTSDARLVSYRPGVQGPAFELVGREQIVTLITRLARYTRTFHLVGNHLCTVDGDHATGQCYCLAHHLGRDEDGMFTRCAPVVYRDIYVRTDDGIERTWALNHLAPMLLSLQLVGFVGSH